MRAENDYPHLPLSRNFTDYYLLALARHHEAKFATLDQRVDPASLLGGTLAYCLIPE
jgi:predicted nucleic acid-binding protein